jgi:hypothetical protein
MPTITKRTLKNLDFIISVPSAKSPLDSSTHQNLYTPRVHAPQVWSSSSIISLQRAEVGQFSFAYSAFASFKMGISGSASSADETAGNGPVKKTLCRANQYGVKGEEDRSISRNLCSANEAYRAGIFREFPIVGQQRNALHSRLGHQDAIERVLVSGR